MTSTFIQRQRRSLDGNWRFRTDPDGTCDLAAVAHGPWRTITVPAPWQSQAPELRTYQGVAWYRRSFEVPASWSGSAVVLHFGAVDYHAEVWVNGARAGEHTGGYLPFDLDVSALVRYGAENDVLVRVLDPSNDRARFPEAPFDEIPHGKQSWYGPLSGIWQSVWVEARAAVHLTRLKITPDARSGRVEVEAALNTDAPAGATLALDVLAPGGERVATTLLELRGAAAQATLVVSSPALWEPDSPALYTLAATLQSAGRADRLETRFGFRTIEARDGALYLNDKPLMLRGALDQDYYPGTIATPPSYEYLLHQAQLAKRMGLNCLRCHIKVADPRYLQAADEAGILVWAELPNWHRWTPEGAERGMQTLLGAIERDWNHPSLVIWTVINESWGVDLVGNPEHRAWLRQAFDTVKAAAPGRLVVDNSACFPNFHLKSDIDDYHIYAAMPDERERWRRLIAQFAARAKWSYGTYAFAKRLKPRHERTPADWDWPFGGDADAPPLPEVERRGDEPLILSEFGNWGLPSLESLRAESGADPWWFETGDDWGDGVVYPHGVEQRFARLGLDRIFGDYERFAEATRRAELDALRFEIEELRRHPSIGGYVITEFTDVHWECNGLLDMRRQPKMPLNALADLNADTLLIPDRTQGALWAGDEQRIAVSASHWGATPLQAPELRWAVTNDARRDPLVVGRSPSAGPIEPRSTVELGVVPVAAPQVERATTLTLRLELWDGGRRVAATDHRVAVFPRPGGALPPLYVDGAPELAARLRQLGYPLQDRPGDYVTVARQWTDELRAQVIAGGHALLLAEDEAGLDWSPGHSLERVSIEPRLGTVRQGSWASSFCWLHGEWPGDGVLDDTFAKVMPEHVILGIPQRDYPNDVLAGLCVGWIQEPAALAGVRRPGRGKVLVTTFRLARHLGADPAATHLFAHLVREAGKR
ncbi:MAG TPA: glycoside hydrolase family 2 TIM barrel-domain containing protein [Roseiflexaceae bacterium]|nr:glycoside hydrolase family 2 TIM barrel-domain containing protein [Roseiflexaceae bacterium]